MSTGLSASVSDPLGRSATFPNGLSASLSSSPGRSATAPVEKRVLKDTDAFNKTVDSLPLWSMGSRDALIDETRGQMITEYGPDISKKLDGIKDRPPVWTMRSRWKAGPVKGSWVPGPGNYKIASTLSKSHPTIPVSGRAWHWGTEPRKGMPESPFGRDTPSPDNYNPKDSLTRESHLPPCIKSRGIDNPPVPAKSGVWGICSSTEAKAGRKLYDATECTRKGGKNPIIEYTFTNRPESCFTPKGDAPPGPGTNNPSIYAYGRVKKSPSFGFGTSSKFPKDLPTRPY